MPMPEREAMSRWPKRVRLPGGSNSPKYSSTEYVGCRVSWFGVDIFYLGTWTLRPADARHN